MRKLYYSQASPFARKVCIVLAEKALEYEADEANAQARPEEAYAKVHPALQVPVLDDNGLRLFESNLILAYLLQTYPGSAPGAPEPPLGESLTRPDYHWEDAKTLAVLETLAASMVNLRQLGLSGVKVEEVGYLQRQQRRIQHCLDWLEERATPEGFAPGIFSIMDLNLFCHLEFAAARDIFPRGHRPNLEAILARYRERPSVKATVPQPPGA
jgi:glutathione S-transferase